MSSSSNRNGFLTPQDEMFTILMEECAEVASASSKIIRFGDSENNTKRLESELGDLMCMVEILSDKGYIDMAMVAVAASAKRVKLKKWAPRIME